MTGTPTQSGAPVTTLFLRLEGPLQSWGGRTIGRFRRTEAFPTKSGVIGLLGAALGLSRPEMNARLDQLNGLAMAVRVDRSGHVEKDYQTVGAKIGVLAADGKIKETASTGGCETIISPREYLVDASFLVILRGDADLIQELAVALLNPKWPLFLGRKRCAPGSIVFAGVDDTLTLSEAIRRDGPEDDSLLPPESSPAVRMVTDKIAVDVFSEIVGGSGADVESRYEQAKSYLTDRLVRLGDPPILPVHAGRIVLDFQMLRPAPTHIRPDLRDPRFGPPPPNQPQRACDPQAKKAARAKAKGRCIFCRFEPADAIKLHAHHLTYIRRGRERVDTISEDTGDDDFVMLCEDCHAAVTMLEYQNGFGLNRIDPREPRWQRRILAAREARRRHANPAYPAIAAGCRPRIEAGAKPLDLVESVIPLRAGSSFSIDSPGNRWLANRHHVHQRLSMAFPEVGPNFAARGYGVARDEGGFHYRIERGPVAKLIVRSQVLPDWGRSFDRASWLVAERIPRPTLFALSDYCIGAEFDFDLEANPVRRLAAEGPDGRMGARVTHREDRSLEEWFARRAADCGFEVLDDKLTIERIGRQTARMKQSADRHWDAVRFTGRLRVADAEKFRAALIRGIGPAKAFGFGLLSIAPINAPA